MYAKAPLHGARQVGKMVKQKHTKDHKKMNKSANTLSERTMTPDERAMFKAAKVKELQSFFDINVWAFETSREAQPSRTLTSRMLLKWSKHPDGSPRAKARLIVRGFQDPDAWDGTVPTSSPTTTRLSRSVLLSLAATMSWGFGLQTSPPPSCKENLKHASFGSNFLLNVSSCWALVLRPGCFC